MTKHSPNCRYKMASHPLVTSSPIIHDSFSMTINHQKQRGIVRSPKILACSSASMKYPHDQIYIAAISKDNKSLNHCTSDAAVQTVVVRITQYLNHTQIIYLTPISAPINFKINWTVFSGQLFMFKSNGQGTTDTYFLCKS